MNFARYKHLLAKSDVRKLLLIGMIARIPHSASGVVLTLHIVNHLHKGFAEAGAAAALFTIGIAIGAPWRGRRVDTVGLRKALIPSIIAEALIWTILPQLEYVWVLPLALVAGVFSLPIFSVIRQALGARVSGGQMRSAFALDSMGTEIVFMIGPAIAAVAAVNWSSTYSLMIIGWATAFSGLLLFWMNPPMRSTEVKSEAQLKDAFDAECEAAEHAVADTAAGNPQMAAGELLEMANRTTAALSSDSRVGSGADSVSVLTAEAAPEGTATAEGAPVPGTTSAPKGAPVPGTTSAPKIAPAPEGTSGVTPAAPEVTAAGSQLRPGQSGSGRLAWLTGTILALFLTASGAGLVLSGTDVSIVGVLKIHDQQQELGIVFLFWCVSSLIGGLIYGAMKRKVSPMLLLLLMAILTIPMGLAQDTWSLAILSFFPGLLCAPVLSSASEQVAELVSEDRRGEAMGWYGSFLTAGSALGSPLTGIFIDQVGAWAGFLVIGAAGVALVLVASLARSMRRRFARA